MARLPTKRGLTTRQSRHVTFIVVQDFSTTPRKIRLHKGWFRVLGVFAVLFVVALTAALGHYGWLLAQALENRRLRGDNLSLIEDLRRAEERLSGIGRDMERLSRLDAKLRALTHLNDTGRNLAIGPLPPADGPVEGEDAPWYTTGAAHGGVGGAYLKAETELLGDKLVHMQRQVTDREKSLEEVEGYFREQESMLASVPALWPAHGWITSEFGFRSDPYTSRAQMHKGLDIAGPHGSPVSAPSDGIVVFTGTSSGYGKMIVIDHGYDITTHYAHLSAIDVSTGQRIARGERIGAIGNTGRSTGPHLHYEVWVGGVPRNPRAYILE